MSQTSKFPSSHSTKEELLSVMIETSERMKSFKKSEKGSMTRVSRANRADLRRNAVFEIFLKLLKLYKLSDRMLSIEGSQTNLKCLLVTSKCLSNWFEQQFSRVPQSQIDENFENFFRSLSMTQNDINLRMTSRLISDAQKSVHQHHNQVKQSCQEQKAFRDSFFKSHTDFDIDFDDADAEEETKLLSIEEAVLIIQKLERKYQAISRRNYVRFVRERAAELQGIKTEIDATQAAIRIQARTRGYFARKQVREMRSKELEVLKMKTESIIKLKMERRIRKIEFEKIDQVDNYPTDLDTAIELLKTNFFLSTNETLEEVRPMKHKTFGDNVYLDACFRGIIGPVASLELNQMVSQRETVRIEGRSLQFDVRSFIILTFCIPLALNTWKSSGSSRWMLFVGGQGSGKSTWVKAIAKACHITHVHISKNVVTLGKRSIYSVIRKLAKQERRLLISIEKIDIMKKDEKSKGLNHRQLLLRNFLTDISHTNATVIAMSRVENAELSVNELFPIQVNISNPGEEARFDLSVDCLSRNLEQDRLPKVPHRIFDIGKQTKGFSYGKVSKFVTNRWSAATNNNKTTMSGNT